MMLLKTQFLLIQTHLTKNAQPHVRYDQILPLESPGLKKFALR